MPRRSLPRLTHRPCSVTSTSVTFPIRRLPSRESTSCLLDTCLNSSAAKSASTSTGTCPRTASTSLDPRKNVWKNWKIGLLRLSVFGCSAMSRSEHCSAEGLTPPLWLHSWLALVRGRLKHFRLASPTRTSTKPNMPAWLRDGSARSEEHTSELQSQSNL